MKKTLLILISTLTLSAVTFAQEETTAKSSTVTTIVASEETTPMLANGIRFSLVKPFFDLTEKLLIKENPGTLNIDYESAGGLAIGYAYLPSDDFGFVGQLAFYEAKMPATKESLNFAKLAMNVGYSADQYISGLVGLNTMRFINNSDLEALNMQVGWQAGLNLQFDENFSLSILNYQMIASGLVDAGASYPAYDQISREIRSEGFEIELGVTF